MRLGRVFLLLVFVGEQTGNGSQSQTLKLEGGLTEGLTVSQATRRDSRWREHYESSRRRPAVDQACAEGW